MLASPIMPSNVPRESLVPVVKKKSNAPQPQSKHVQVQPVVHGPSPKPQISWAEVARAPTLSKLLTDQRSKFEKCRASLVAKGFNAQQRTIYIGPRTEAATKAIASMKPQPTATAVYFGGIPRGPIGDLKQALYECLPKRCILRISFIGNSACEILCHKHLQSRLISGMNLLGFRQLTAYDPLKSSSSSFSEESTRRLKMSSYRRWRWSGRKTFSPIAKLWYESASAVVLATDLVLKNQLLKEDVLHSTPKTQDTTVADAQTPSRSITAAETEGGCPWGSNE